MSSPSTSPSSPSASVSMTARRRSRVSTEHTLTRVRENQRRHRARRRDYIQTLELQLAEAELQFEAARAEIVMLRAERQIDMARTNYDGALNAQHDRKRLALQLETFESSRDSAQELGGSNKHPALDLTALTQETAAALSMNTLMEYPASRSEYTSASSPTSPLATSLSLLLDEAHIPECLPTVLPAIPPPCCTDPPTLPMDIDPVVDPQLSLSPPSSSSTSNPPSSPSRDNAECTTCATRPAPSPSESTTLCSQAYVMISDQNFRQIDTAIIRLWLWQGYRRAMKRGEGCRVENGVLMGVLDFISGEL